jgi:uracil-DNA glycosylase family 4
MFPPDSSIPQGWYSAGCRRCERLAHHLDAVRADHPGYHAAPVPPFGDPDARLLIVGLAPGMHGANRTGRPFTGDYAGILLYEALHHFGFANQAAATDPADGLELTGCRITNAVKCLPPQNKPLPAEVRSCNGYLRSEIAALPAHGSILALGRIAHQAVLAALALKLRDHPFAHGAVHRLPQGVTLHDSYHCSRYNTQIRRLTREAFFAVFETIIRLRNPAAED